MTVFGIVKQRTPAAWRRACVLSCASALHFLAAAGWAQPPAWMVARLPGAALGCLRGQGEPAVALFACARTCVPVPWQLDERDGDGRWALDGGPEPTADDPTGIIDDNDELLWMAADGGRRAHPAELPASNCRLEIAQQGGGTANWVYAVAMPPPAPRSPRRYVAYDAALDRVDAGRVVVGFGAPTPRFLALRDDGGALGKNLLDRLKIRARARFFGIIPLGRDEDDIEYRFSAWRAGPIRVLRREYQWVRLASWLRTPIFESETLITRDAMTLPVRLRLNFPPTYFFAGIEVQAVLDFRDLRGWQVRAAAAPPATVGSGGAALDGVASEWVALRGSQATLALVLELGDSLATLAPTLVYRDDGRPEPPEEKAGERPGVGYRLARWSEIDRGAHWFAALAYALPADADLEAFARARRETVTLSVTALASDPAP